jgi:hypothetical protein
MAGWARSCQRPGGAHGLLADPVMTSRSMRWHCGGVGVGLAIPASHSNGRRSWNQ